MRKPGNVLLLAILIGALSAAMVYRYLRDQQTALEAARNAAVGTTVDVAVARDPIPIGSRIEPQQLKLVRWPVDAEPDGAVHDPARIIGRIARISLDKHQPVIESHLVAEGTSLHPLLIADGLRAMSVKVDEVPGVSGFITAICRVDVLVSGYIVDGGSNREQRSKLVLQNISVVATGTSIEQRDDKPVEVPTVTLLVTPEDAERLTLAARQEPVRLALRGYRDEEDVTTPGVSTRQLFGQNGTVSAAKASSVRRRPPPVAPSVEVLLGEERTRQRF
jgi:pilus assembly protein CpaB